jgi:hypothetical protein
MTDAATTSLVGEILNHGTWGLVCAGLLLAVRTLWVDLKEEKKGRLEDQKAYTTTLVAQSDKVHDVCHEMAKVAELLERRTPR